MRLYNVYVQSEPEKMFMCGHVYVRFEKVDIYTARRSGYPRYRTRRQRLCLFQ